MKPINVTSFYHDGRGPELRRVHWKHDGRVLVAADYSNHDDFGKTAPRHVVFARAQVVQVTPEEVIDYTTLGPVLAAHRPAAMFDLGKSSWLGLFSPQHLEPCHHFKLMFYDELFDVICEGITCHLGPFRGEAG